MFLIRSFYACLLSVFLLSGCDFAPTNQQDESLKTIQVKHEKGETTIVENPTRVVVFNPSILDTMDALDIPIIGVPQSGAHYPAYLQKYMDKQYTNVGTFFEPNYEALSALAPQLIIGGGRAADAYRKLSEIAPTLEFWNGGTLQENIINALTELGLIFNKTAQAEQLIAQFNQKINAIAQRVQEKDAGQQNSAMVLMINGGKLANFNAGSRFGFVFDNLGFKAPENLPKGEGQHGNILSPELIAKVNPQWLFILNRDNAIGVDPKSSDSFLRDHSIMTQTAAWKKKQVIYLNSDEIYIAGGYQAYLRLMDQIEIALDQAQ